MADRTCSVEDCGRKHYGKGLCEMHYARQRRVGSLEVSLTPKGEPLRYLLEVVLKHKNKKACLIWPYGRNSGGYATIRYKKKRGLKVHRIVCRKIHGKPPTEKHVSRHLCGKGHEGCINPHHLKWGTLKQNSADRKRHGTDKEVFGERHGMSKLTESDVKKIIRLINKGLSNRDIAKKFPVGPWNIEHIRQGKSWKCIPR